MARIACAAAIMLLAACSALVWIRGAAAAAADPNEEPGLLGTTSLRNRAAPMTVRNLAMAGNTALRDAGDVQLIVGRTYQFLVTTGITSVTSWCRMSNATGNFEQKVLTWSTDSNRKQPVPCGPDCVWEADGRGFWITNPAGAQAQVFVAGWNLV